MESGPAERRSDGSRRAAFATAPARARAWARRTKTLPSRCARPSRRTRGVWRTRRRLLPTARRRRQNALPVLTATRLAPVPKRRHERRVAAAHAHVVEPGNRHIRGDLSEAVSCPARRGDAIITSTLPPASTLTVAPSHGQPIPPARVSSRCEPDEAPLASATRLLLAQPVVIGQLQARRSSRG